MWNSRGGWEKFQNLIVRGVGIVGGGEGGGVEKKLKILIAGLGGGF